MDIQYLRASSDDELYQILALQRKNALDSIDASEQEKEGFITVSHDYAILKSMNDACPHIIAKDGGKVIGYALVMLKEFKDEISILSAMFKTATELLGTKNYLAMGQVCIAKAYRRQGVFKEMYWFYREELRHTYDCLLTEVATNNQRSLNAHLNLGFQILKTQTSDDISWELICWDWN